MAALLFAQSIPLIKAGLIIVWLVYMPFSETKKKVTLTFQSINTLSLFKKECECDDFYVDRDTLTLVGSFTEEQLQVANYKYLATYQPKA